ncbi:MAG: N-acyl-D-glutamate deacylase [Gemmatimonadaceae bacterium]|nr:N-acyl-D-glutamate deacylase [Gemmatimonadaceae bacterium]
MSHPSLTVSGLAFWLLVLACSGEPRSGDGTGLVIRGARIADGTGAAMRTGSVRIEQGRIVAVGDFASKSGDSVVNARGLVLAPGFIDTHSHASSDLARLPDALAAVSQGVTTVIGGQDGGSPLPLKDFLDSLGARGSAVNVAMYSGHGSIRRAVLGESYRRPATEAEIERMRLLLEADLDAGALGLSSGLEYDPGIYASTEELIALAREAAGAGGRYISHIRSEDFAFWNAIDEIIRIGREAKVPVQISHAKLAMRDLWGRADSLVTILDRARASGVDVTADVYPYLYWQSTLTVLFPKRDFTNRASAEFALTQTSTPGGLLLGAYAPNPAYAGRTVAQVANLRGVDSVTALIDLIRDAEAMAARLGPAADTIAIESVIGTSMVESDVETIMRWPYANLCTDGELDGPHPRGFGSFPRFFGHYVRERGVMSLEEGVRRATSLAAANVGLRDRGTIAVGQAADLVLFDPATIGDRATTAAPHAISIGVERVWVNGVEVYRDGTTTGARPGTVLRRHG